MNKSNKKVVKKVKRRKVKKKVILVFLILTFLLSLLSYYIYNIRITNIYIIGNEILNDQAIIEIAGLEDYPKTIQNSSKTITERLEDNDYIKKAKVEKKGFLKEIYITIEENKPLIFYQIKDKVVLEDGKEVSGNFNIPVVTNEINSNVYDEFLECMSKIDNDILAKISEIKYDPNDIDEERFYLTMNDGNYVYVTLHKFAKINNYITIVKSFNGSKGILYLDSGEYFEKFAETNE